MPGDPFKEIISGGLLASYAPGGLAERRGISAHFQSVIRHFGGQVDVLDEPMQTRSNLAAGIEYHFLPELNMLNRVTLSSYYMLALELSPTNTIQYDKGFALHNTLGFENKWVKLNAGWFHGKTFFAPWAITCFNLFRNSTVRTPAISET